MARETLLKIRIWAKLIVLGLVVIYCLLFVTLNRHPVDLWLLPFMDRVRTTVLVAVLGAFILGALLTLIVRMFMGTIRQIREHRERDRTSRLEREVAEMRTKAGGLRTRQEGPAGGARGK